MEVGGKDNESRTGSGYRGQERKRLHRAGKEEATESRRGRGRICAPTYHHYHHHWCHITMPHILAPPHLNPPRPAPPRPHTPHHPHPASRTCWTASRASRCSKSPPHHHHHHHPSPSPPPQPAPHHPHTPRHPRPASRTCRAASRASRCSRSWIAASQRPARLRTSALAAESSSTSACKVFLQKTVLTFRGYWVYF